jgi:hypothetical protein
MELTMISESPTEMIITSGVLASLIFDSIRQMKNKIYEQMNNFL